MRKTTEMTRGYQFWYMISRELIGVAICAFIQFLLFMPSYGNNIFRNVSGVLFVLVNFCVIYDGAAVLGKADNKPYSRLNYSIKYSVLWGVALSVLSILSMLMFALNWHLGATDGVLKNPLAVIINIIFYVLQSPYIAYLVMTPSKIPIFVAVLNTLLPIVATIAGYISGKKEFSISDKLSKLMFEKDSKDT